MPIEEKPSIPDITPMRRGRPHNSSAEHSGHRPSPSPMRVIASDPFAALDAAPGTASDTALLDEASARFPPLDQFSILHESANKFAFDQNPPGATPAVKDISQRVTEALADDAFALPVNSKSEPLTHSKSVPTSAVSHSLKPSITRQPLPKVTRTQAVQQPMPILQAIPQQPKMVSIGTMTSPSPPPAEINSAAQSSRPIFRFPPQTDQRSTSQPRALAKPRPSDTDMERGNYLAHRPTLADHRSKSQTPTLSMSRTSAPSRPSLDSDRPIAIDYEESLGLSRSFNSSNRPVSAHIDSSRKFPFTRSPSRGAPNLDSQRDPIQGLDGQRQHMTDSSSEDDAEPTKIASNVDFLKAMEEEDPNKRKDKRSSSGSKHSKRSSMPSISLSGTKSLLAGRFGEAFRRFETNTSGSVQRDPSPVDRRTNDLTPIAGSEATDGRSDDGQVLEETTDAPPEVRRELERRRLSQEERRVAEAAAAYKQRVAERGPESGRGRRDGTRAALIQNKVQALLVENGKSSPTKTAEGYGKYTDRPQPSAATNVQLSSTPPMSTASAPPLLDRPFLRPSAPPKPQALRTGGNVEPFTQQRKQLGTGPSNQASASTYVNSEDWETDFSKRYPNLSGIEMVETTIDKNGAVITTKDV